MRVQSPCKVKHGNGSRASKSSSYQQCVVVGIFFNGFTAAAGFDKAAEHLCYAPRLSTASSRGEGRFGIENLTDGAYTGTFQMIAESVKKASRGCEIVGVNSKPGIDKRPDKPRPNRTSMISCVARAEIAVVPRFVIALPGRK